MNIYVTTPEGGPPEQLTFTRPGSRWNEYPAWSPDGQTIAFSSLRDGFGGQLYLMDPAGNAQRAITDGPGDWYPAWSPRGDAIAFASGRNGHNHSGVYVTDLDGRLQTRLTEDDTISRGPTWRPGGGSIAYVSNRDDLYDLHIMDDQGRHLTQLTDSWTYDTSPSWHPRADTIAFVSWNTGDPNAQATGDIHTIDADGSDEQRVTKRPAWDTDPCWSPSGTQILLSSHRDGHAALFVTDTDGGAVRRVTQDRFVSVFGSSWFDPDIPRGVSPVSRQMATWGWLKRVASVSR